jgi:hypothetical protein
MIISISRDFVVLKLYTTQLPPKWSFWKKHWFWSSHLFRSIQIPSRKLKAHFLQKNFFSLSTSMIVSHWENTHNPHIGKETLQYPTVLLKWHQDTRDTQPNWNQRGESIDLSLSRMRRNSWHCSTSDLSSEDSILISGLGWQNNPPFAG